MEAVTAATAGTAAITIIDAASASIVAAATSFIVFLMASLSVHIDLFSVTAP